MSVVLRMAMVVAMVIAVSVNAQKDGAAEKKEAPAQKQQEQAQPAAEKAEEKAPAKQAAAEAEDTQQKAQPEKKAAAKPAPKAQAESAASDSDVDIARIAVCTGIADREPDGTAESFGADVGKLYCFTHVKGVQGSLGVQHKWYHGDELRSTVPLTVKSSSWRTYSSKTLDPSWTGEWRVDVVNGETGDVLASATFVVN